MGFIKGLLTLSALAGCFAGGTYAGWHAHKLTGEVVTAMNRVEQAKSAVMFWEDNGND
jgi:hypothetical protein